jgi:hypothetical protein
MEVDPFGPPQVEETNKQRLFRQIQEILARVDNESDIPVTSEYWDLLRQYRGVLDGK